MGRRLYQLLTDRRLHSRPIHIVAEGISVRAFFRKLLAAERGATAVEYALIISMIVLAMVGVLTEVASKTTGMWNNVANEVSRH